MSIKFNIKTNQKKLAAKFKKLGAKLPRIIDKGVKQAGFQLVEIIRTKTKKGIDFNDSPFAPYSEGYLNKLNREGKKTIVDLFYTGRMLGSLTPSSVKKTGKHKVSINFTNAEMRKRALFNQVLNDPKRKFFGFNSRTEKIISKQFKRFVEKELRNFRI
jgi:hypothetical protein|tara:strand:- start:326 stop:802 length:477 start_codon:yes stop_codon:yes gene_type:complete